MLLLIGKCCCLSWSHSLLTLALFLLAYIGYRTVFCRHRFFANIGVDYVTPWPLLGNFAVPLLFRTAFSDVQTDHYQRFKHRSFYGFFEFTTPLLVVRDPELIRNITVRDFDHFGDHRHCTNNEPLLGQSLIQLTGTRWRDMRSTLTPAFTGSKLRHMFPLIADCANVTIGMLQAGAQSVGSNGPYMVNMRDVTMRYAIDVIASTAFGLQVNTSAEQDIQFHRMISESMQFKSRLSLSKLALITSWPTLCSWLGIQMFTDEQRTFYHSLVHDTIRLRERYHIQRPDMIHLLMEARRGVAQEADAVNADYDGSEFAANGAGMQPEQGSEDVRGGSKRVWSEMDMTAQCFLFAFAGTKSLSTLLSFAAQELIENRHVQDKLLAELDDAERQLDGRPFTYDVLYKLPYLDMVVSETLRKWPPILSLDRLCTRDYEMTDASNGHTITVRHGDSICVPVLAIQRDPQFFAQPDVFDPERFSQERRHLIQPFTYLALGAGPRNCFGSRFVLMEVKSFLCGLLREFSLESGPGSQIPIPLNGGGFMLSPEDNRITIGLRRRVKTANCC